jgi:hypothetical protein
MAFKRFLIAATVAALAHGCSAGSPIRSSGQADDVTLKQVIARTTEAMGGRRDLARLRNLRLKAEWIEGGSKFTGDYRATRDGRMRIDVFITASAFSAKDWMRVALGSNRARAPKSPTSARLRSGRSSMASPIVSMESGRRTRSATASRWRAGR